jgi:hypothetical protein
MKSNFVDFEISNEQDESHAIRFDTKVSVIGEGDKKIFHRRAVKPFATDGATQSSLLVCKLDDVYLYCNGNGHFVLTKQANLKP